MSDVARLEEALTDLRKLVAQTLAGDACGGESTYYFYDLESLWFTPKSTYGDPLGKDAPHYTLARMMNDAMDNAELKVKYALRTHSQYPAARVQCLAEIDAIARRIAVGGKSYVWLPRTKKFGCIGVLIGWVFAIGAGAWWLHRAG